MTDERALRPQQPSWAESVGVPRPGLVKGAWTADEDRIIAACVDDGITKWSEIADRVPGRVGKQCRERWFNHLDPSLKQGGWTEGEDAILVDAQSRWGDAWTRIAKLLPGRSETAVKNRWHSAARRDATALGRAAAAAAAAVVDAAPAIAAITPAITAALSSGCDASTHRSATASDSRVALAERRASERAKAHRDALHALVADGTDSASSHVTAASHDGYRRGMPREGLNSASAHAVVREYRKHAQGTSHWDPALLERAERAIRHEHARSHARAADGLMSRRRAHEAQVLAALDPKLRRFPTKQKAAQEFWRTLPAGSAVENKGVGAITPGKDPRVFYCEMDWNDHDKATVVVVALSLDEWVFAGRALS